jgi:hypothetical protein
MSGRRDLCRGVRPSQAANSLPERNSDASPTVAANRRRDQWANAGDFYQPLADRVCPMPVADFCLDRGDPFWPSADDLVIRLTPGMCPAASAIKVARVSGYGRACRR